MVLFLDLVLVDERPKGTKTLRRPNSNFKPAHRPDYPEQLEASLCALMSVVLTDTEGTRTPDRTDPAALFSCQSPFLDNPTLLVLRLPSPQCSSSLYCFFFFSPESAYQTTGAHQPSFSSHPSPNTTDFLTPIISRDLGSEGFSPPPPYHRFTLCSGSLLTFPVLHVLMNTGGFHVFALGALFLCRHQD